MPKRGVLILECRGRSDPGSEGKFLARMFQLMKVPHQYLEVRTKRQFLALLRTSPFRIIHVSTHGFLREGRTRDRFKGFWAPDGEIGAADLEKLKGKLKGISIVSTACRSAERRFGKALIKIAGADYYVAPKRSPRFHNAILFAHIFYHKLFVRRKDVSDILAEYAGRYRNPHEFAAVSLEDYIQRTVK
jgi:hypothetical protein